MGGNSRCQQKGARAIRRVHPAIAAIVGAKECTRFGTGIEDTEPVSLSRVTHINRSDHRVVDARSGWLPIPAAVAASEETVTRSSAVHLSRTAQVDRDTFGRSSAQVRVDRPGTGAPSDQQGRACHDYEPDHDSIFLELLEQPGKGRFHFDEDRPAQGSLSKKR